MILEFYGPPIPAGEGPYDLETDGPVYKNKMSKVCLVHVWRNWIDEKWELKQFFRSNFATHEVAWL